MIIYKTTNLINEKVYVDQDMYNRPSYLGSGKYIQSAIKKYGKENFIKEIIDFAEAKQELDKKEKEWIKFYNCKAPKGYNLTDGGLGSAGYVWTKEQREKQLEHWDGMKGENNPAKRPEVREKISFIRRKFLTDHPEVIDNFTGENNPTKRSEVKTKIKVRTKEGMAKPEVREKCRQSAISNWSIPEVKIYISKRIKEGQNNSITKKKMSLARKKFIFEHPEVIEKNLRKMNEARNRPEVKEKMSLAKIGKTSGAKGKHWKWKKNKYQEDII